MSLPFVILNHAVSAYDIAIVSDNALAPENPKSFLMTNSPPLVRAATWPRECACRCNVSSPPLCLPREDDSSSLVASVEKGTACIYDKAMIQTLKLIDVYKSPANVSHAEGPACALGQHSRGRIPSMNATRILSEALKSTLK